MTPSVATDVAQAATAHIRELEVRIAELEAALAAIEEASAWAKTYSERAAKIARAALGKP